jgi:hypothetical protein
MARLDANVLNYVLWSIDYHELTRIAHRKRSVQHAVGNAIEQMVIPRLWGFELSQGKHIDSIWCQTWSISRCYPVRDKPQSVSIGDDIDRKNCRTVCHDRFENLHGVSSQIFGQKGSVVES